MGGDYKEKSDFSLKVVIICESYFILPYLSQKTFFSATQLHSLRLHPLQGKFFFVFFRKSVYFFFRVEKSVRDWREKFVLVPIIWQYFAGKKRICFFFCIFYLFFFNCKWIFSDDISFICFAIFFTVFKSLKTKPHIYHLYQVSTKYDLRIGFVPWDYTVWPASGFQNIVIFFGVHQNKFGDLSRMKTSVLGNSEFIQPISHCFCA